MTKKDGQVLKLRTVVFEILRTDESETLPSMKDLKVAVMDKLRMDNTSTNAAPNADTLATIVEEYKNLNSKKNLQAAAAYAADDGMRKQKFSKYESDFIMNCIRDFVASEAIEMKELCPHLRDAHDKQRKDHKIWSDLATYLPYRQRVAIHQHAVRRIMREYGGERSKGFTPEEKEQLKKLVDERGQEWSNIGRLMNKLDDDCKSMYFRMQGRKVTGKFSKEEDERLLKAVRAVGITQGFCASDTAVADLPEKGIAWKKVAEEMDKERQPLDYLRRWPFAKRVAAAQEQSAEGDKKGKKSAATVVDAPMMRKMVAVSREAAGQDAEVCGFTLRWLEEVAAFQAENESDVIWAEIDKTLNLPHACSAQKWRAMKKAFPNSENVLMPTILSELLAQFRKDLPPGASSSSSSSGLAKALPAAAASSRRAAPPAAPAAAPAPKAPRAAAKPAAGIAAAQQSAAAASAAAAAAVASSSSSSAASSSSSSSSIISNIVSAAAATASGVMSMIGRRPVAATTEASLPVDEPAAVTTKAKKGKAAAAAAAAADAGSSSPKPLPLEPSRASKKRAAEAEAGAAHPSPAGAANKPLKKRPHDEMLAASALVAGPDVDDKKKGKKAKTDGADKGKK